MNKERKNIESSIEIIERMGEIITDRIIAHRDNPSINPNVDSSQQLTNQNLDFESLINTEGMHRHSESRQTRNVDQIVETTEEDKSENTKYNESLCLSRSESSIHFSRAEM